MPDEINPTALSPEVAAAVLARSCGQPVTADMIRDDIADGCPTNADGTLHLVTYVAWMIQEQKRG